MANSNELTVILTQYDLEIVRQALKLRYVQAVRQRNQHITGSKLYQALNETAADISVTSAKFGG